MPKLGQSKSINPISLEVRVIAEIITPLDLSPDDQEWVIGELKWLFRAVENFLQVYQAAQQRLEEEKFRLIRKYSLNIQRERERDRLRPQIWQEEVSKSPPVAVAIPPQAERLPQADNNLLNNLDDFALQRLGDAIESNLNLMNSYFERLKHLLERETTMGAAGKSDVFLQNQIRRPRLEIVKLLKEIADHLHQAYGVLATTPGQLVDLLQQ